MKFPESEGLGIAKDNEGNSYHMEFYGENEGAAVITGPIQYNTMGLVRVPEVHREPASDPDDAFAKLSTQISARGWPQATRQKERVLWTAPSAAETVEMIRASREKK